MLLAISLLLSVGGIRGFFQPPRGWAHGHLLPFGTCSNRSSVFYSDDAREGSIGRFLPRVRLSLAELSHVERVVSAGKVQWATGNAYSRDMSPLEDGTNGPFGDFNIMPINSAPPRPVRNGTGRPHKSGCYLTITSLNNVILASRYFEGRLWSPRMMNSTTVAVISTDKDTQHMYASDTKIVLWNLETDHVHLISIKGCHHDYVYNPVTDTFLCVFQKRYAWRCSSFLEDGQLNEPVIQDSSVDITCAYAVQAQYAATSIDSVPEKVIDPERYKNTANRVMSRTEERRMNSQLNERMREGRFRSPRRLAKPPVKTRERFFLSDGIVELNMNGDIIWQWDSKGFLTGKDNANTIAPQVVTMAFVAMTTRKHIARFLWNRTDVTFDPRSAILLDSLHFNSISYDADEELMIITSRHTDTLFALNKRTQSIEWSVGRMSQFKNFDLQGQRVISPLYGAHGGKLVYMDKNIARLVFMDNDRMNWDRCLSGNSSNDLRCAYRQKTRMREVEVDFQAQTSKVTWEWEPLPRHESIAMRVAGGGADFFPNGNVMATMGRDSLHPVIEVARPGIDYTLTPNQFTGSARSRVVWSTNVTGSFLYMVNRIANRPGLRFQHCVGPLTSKFTFRFWDAFPRSATTRGRVEAWSMCGECEEKFTYSADLAFPPFFRTGLHQFDTLRPYGNLTIRLHNSDGLFATVLINFPCLCQGGTR